MNRQTVDSRICISPAEIIRNGIWLRLRTHLIVGIGLSSFLSNLIVHDLFDVIVIILAGSLSSILPDTDILLRVFNREAHRSAISHSLGGSLIIGFVFLLAATFLTLTGFTKVSIDSYLALFFICSVSAFSHVALDALTVRGVVLFWPFSRRIINGRVKYDGLVANFLLSLLGLTLLALAIIT